MADRVTFSSGTIVVGVVGVLGGVAIACGVPVIVIKLGSHLPGWFHGLVIVLALLIGGLTALVSAFFAIAVPKEAQSGWADVAVAAIKSQEHKPEAPTDESAEVPQPPGE